jgi:hypothetical protein
VTKTINLSLGGMRISSDSKLPMTKPLDLFVILESRATPLKGEIVYSQRDLQDPSEFHTGIRIREMSSADKKALESFLTTVSKRDAAG